MEEYKPAVLLSKEKLKKASDDEILDDAWSTLQEMAIFHNNLSTKLELMAAYVQLDPQPPLYLLAPLLDRSEPYESEELPIPLSEWSLNQEGSELSLTESWNEEYNFSNKELL